MDFENSLMSVSHIRTTGWCTVKTPKQSEQTGTGKTLLYHVKSKGGGGGRGEGSGTLKQYSRRVLETFSKVSSYNLSHPVSPVYNAHTLSYPLFTMLTLCHIPCLQCSHSVISPVYNVYTMSYPLFTMFTLSYTISHIYSL